MSYRARLPGDSDESGFTVVEILVSSAILFFVATALFGLVSTSTMLSLTAKADTIAVNAANSFLEQVRRLPYNQINQAEINTLAQGASTTVDGIVVSVTAVVTPQWLPGQNQATTPAPYARVQVRVTATGPIGRPFVFNTGTFVGNLRPSGSAVGTPTPGAPGGAVKPTFDWLGAPTVAVVRGDSVRIQVDVGSGDPLVNVTHVNLFAGQSLLATLSPDAPSAQLSAVWRTLSLNPDGTAMFPDGTYSIIAEARNSVNIGNHSQLTWTVDNFPPQAPGTPTVVSTDGNTRVTHQWPAAMDGFDRVTEYEIEWWRQNPVNSGFSREAGPVVTQGESFARTTVPFTRYRLDVRSLGPAVTAPMDRHVSATTQAFFISRPSFTSTSTVELTTRGSDGAPAVFNINLSAHRPAFGTTGTTSYLWQTRYGFGTTTVGAWTTVSDQTGARFLNTSWTAPQNGRFDGGRGWVEFRCLVSVTPDGGTAVQVPSSIVRFTRSANNAGITTRDIAEDWTGWTGAPLVTPAIDWRMWAR